MHNRILIISYYTPQGKTQGDVWGENIILNANQVEFPSDAKAPKVSEEAKDLIRACLTRDQRLRYMYMYVCTCMSVYACVGVCVYAMYLCVCVCICDKLNPRYALSN
ncbi:hypothetical protein EON65_41160 [archaeon]|nr:MAG: hypothetical protein EON65_41160 [archaeon]